MDNGSGETVQDAQRGQNRQAEPGGEYFVYFWTGRGGGAGGQTRGPPDQMIFFFFFGDNMSKGQAAKLTKNSKKIKIKKT
ncbi:hypothetical protein ACYCMK_25035, partial [Klebsiella pneumoniae]